MTEGRPFRRVTLPLLLALLPASAQAGPGSGEVSLRSGSPTVLYVAPGHVTTLIFHTGRKLSAISLASPVVSYRYDKALNQLEITPSVRTPGFATNLNLRIGANEYVLDVRVVDDVRAQFAENVTLGDDPGGADEEDLSAAGPLRPERVDVVAAARMFERAETDPVFRSSQPGLRIEPIGRSYLWNDCLVTLDRLAQFTDSDMLVFRVKWLNGSGRALYLDATQYGLFVSGRRIPITARYKLGCGPVVYPGQFETVYLAVQGYRLSRHNDWQLGLPPDSGTVGRLLGL
jgi:hypothetical protein